VYTDRRLTAVYDLINPHLEDTEFYLDLARDAGAIDVIDLGCGTGRLAVRLAAMGCNVTGVDPSPQMIAVAQSKPGAEKVRWIEGGAGALEGLEADLVLMTGHVAQFFLADLDWLAALTHIRQALRRTGRLAFETRNPTSEPWRMWTSELSRRVTPIDSGPLETWYEVSLVQDRKVTYSLHYRFPSGELATDHNVVVFRDQDEIANSLAECGYVIEQAFGNWDRSPLSPTSPELIYVASAGSPAAPSPSTRSRARRRPPQ
jgi:SAM-dependent methyltransferase